MSFFLLSGLGGASLAEGQADQVSLAKQGYRGFNILLMKEHYYAIPQGEGKFDTNKLVRKGYSQSFQADEYDTIVQQIDRYYQSASAARQEARVKLITVGYRGFNLLFLAGRYYAIPQGEGEFNISYIRQGKYTQTYQSFDQEDLMLLIDKNHTAVKLLQEGYRGFNILQVDQQYYAIPQGEGNFDLGKIARKEYSKSYQAESYEKLISQIK